MYIRVLNTYKHTSATMLIASLLVMTAALVPTQVEAADQVIFLTATGSGTWSVPSDWTSSNTIEVIGAGGGGSASTEGSGGGGGGGYAVANNVSLTPDGSVGYSVGAGGTPGNDGGDTWFCNSTSDCASIGGTAVIAGANGGAAPSDTTGGAGGSTTGAVGDTTYAGGSGGNAFSNVSSGGGGGGAAGPLGAGAVGGAVAGSTEGAGGGGGANNGTAGSAPSSTDGGNGGDSGTGGQGGDAGATDGEAGADGGGGEGANRAAQGGNGGAGGDGTSVWTQTSDSATAGPGGGGGAGANSSTGGNPGGNGGDGGTYGGGAGGYGDDTDGNGTSGTGGQGIIVITYTPSGDLLTLTGNIRFQSSVAVTGALSKGSGTFVIDHPLDPENKLLYHSFVESPDVKNLYDGTAQLDEGGKVTIRLPDYFEALNKDFRYQFFPHTEAMPGLHIEEHIEDNQFTIAGGVPYGVISWQVTGTRHDPYIEANPVRVEVPKTPTSDIPLGECAYRPLCDGE